MLLILMLQQLTELTERLVALLAAVGHVGHRTRSTATVSQKGTLRHVLPHRPLRRGKVINLLPRIVLAKAALAETRLHVLHCVRAGAEALLSTHRARHVARSVDLHVHVQLVLRVEVAVALAALIGHAIPSLVVRIVGPAVPAIPTTAASVPTASSITPFAATISVHTTLATGQAGAFPPLVRAEAVPVEIVTAIAAFAAHDDNDNDGLVVGLCADSWVLKVIGNASSSEAFWYRCQVRPPIRNSKNKNDQSASKICIALFST